MDFIPGQQTVSVWPAAAAICAGNCMLRIGIGDLSLVLTGYLRVRLTPGCLNPVTWPLITSPCIYDRTMSAWPIGPHTCLHVECSSNSQMSNAQPAQELPANLVGQNVDIIYVL
jgi:hypothetical protein